MAKINIRNRNDGKFYKDGRKKPPNWEYRFEGAKINNKRTQITQAGFKTKKEAEIAGNKAYNEYLNSGQCFKPSEISVADYMDYWIETYCKTNLKETSVEGYKKKIRLYIKPELGIYYLKSLTPAILQAFINQKFNEGFSRNTLSVIKGLLSGSLDYAVEPCKFISQNPMVFVKLPLKRATPDKPSRKKERRAVTSIEWSQIMERFPEGHPAHLPMVLSYRCGLRLGEVFGLMWEDVDFSRNTIRIDRQIQMNELYKNWEFSPPKYDSYRTISVDSDTIDLLKREYERQNRAYSYYGEHYCQLFVKDHNRTDHLFNNGFLSLNESSTPVHMIMTREDGTYIQPRIMQHVGRVIHGKNNKTGTPISEDWDFHSLRHTHATMLQDIGVPIPLIQERLGHTKLQMTERYTHVTEKMKSELTKQLAVMYNRKEPT